MGSSLPGFEIPTRQKSDILFSTKTPLLSGTRILNAMKVAGYGTISFFATANAVFELRIFEACASGGPFAQTQVLTSVLRAGEQVVCEHAIACGVFMRVEIVPTPGPLTALEVCGQGVPVP